MGDLPAASASPSATRAQAVLDKLATVGLREGYRAAAPPTATSARSALSSPIPASTGWDSVCSASWPSAAPGARPFLDVLRAGSLELAEPAVTVPDREDTSLHVALDLALAPDETLAELGENPLWVLPRNLTGNAQPTLSPIGRLLTNLVLPTTCSSLTKRRGARGSSVPRLTFRGGNGG